MRGARSPSPVGENHLPRSENLSASPGRNRGTHMVQIIPEKITPPVELPRVSRERLLATLCESLEGCNSTIIHGRAGTGKTMLATDFARRTKRSVTWYKLDAPDSEFPVFLQHFCA